MLLHKLRIEKSAHQRDFSILLHILYYQKLSSIGENTTAKTKITCKAKITGIP